MPAPSPEPLRKITIRIYERDHALLKTTFGEGYQIHVRTLIARWCERVMAKSGG